MSDIDESAARNPARFDEIPAELLNLWQALDTAARADLLVIARGLAGGDLTNASSFAANEPDNADDDVARPRRTRQAARQPDTMATRRQA